MALQRVRNGRRTAVMTGGALLLGLAAILAGCDLAGRQAPVPAPGPVSPGAPPPPAAPPQLQPPVGFYFNEDGDTVSLAYGRANSDDVQLMLQCERGSHKVQIIDVARDGARKGPASLVLTSGAVRSPLKAVVGPDETGLTLATAEAPSSLPALLSFKTSGFIRVELGASAYSLTASEGEKGGVARFFGACDRKR